MLLGAVTEFEKDRTLAEADLAEQRARHEEFRRHLFCETEIEIIESFYATISYARTAKELQLDPRKVRNTVLRALTRLPEGSQLRTALQMAFAHLNIRQEPDG